MKTLAIFITPAFPLIGQLADGSIAAARHVAQDFIIVVLIGGQSLAHVVHHYQPAGVVYSLNLVDQHARSLKVHVIRQDSPLATILHHLQNLAFLIIY